MSDEIIAKAITQIVEHEAAAAHHNSEAARLKSFVNQYDQFAGREPRYGDLPSSAMMAGASSVSVAAILVKPAKIWAAGDFLGKPFATAAKIIMQARYESAGKPNPATVDEIRDALLQGTYDFGPGTADQQKRGISIALGKNTAVFVRLPSSDLFGHALSLYFVWYNFVKMHKTLRMTPAMAAGLVSSPLEMSDIVTLIDKREGAPKKRGPYRKREQAAEISGIVE